MRGLSLCCLPVERVSLFAIKNFPLTVLNPGAARWIVPLGTLLVALAARLYHLGYMPLWIDEALSEWYARQAVADLLNVVPAYRNHPSLYWIVLKGWVSIFGSTEGGLRGLSVLFSLCTLPFIYWLGRCTAPGSMGVRVGTLCALFFAISPLQVHYAQEARPYAALALCATVALLGLVLILQNLHRWYRRSHDASPSLRGTKRDFRPTTSPFLAWTLLGGGSAGVVCLHNAGWLFVFSIAMTVMLALAASGRARSPRLQLHVVSTTLGVALLHGYLSPYTYRQVEQVREAFWVDPITPQATWTAVCTVLGGIHGWPTVFALTALGLSYLGFTFMLNRAFGTVAVALLVAALLPLLLITAISYSVAPILVPRVLIYSNTPVLILAGAGAASFADRRVRLVVVGVFVTLSLTALFDYYTRYYKEPWHRIVADVQSRSTPTDVVLFVPNYASIPFQYYLRNDLPHPALHALPRDFPAPLLERPHPTGFGAAPAITIEDDELVRALVKHADHVWLVTNRADLYDPASVVHRVLAEQFHRDETISVVPTVYRYSRSSSRDPPSLSPYRAR